jgi:uncharacterized membrane protein
VWLWISLGAALLFAISTVIDTWLVSKVRFSAAPAALLMLSGLASLPLLAILGWAVRHDLALMDGIHAIGAMTAGLLAAGSLYLYYRALIAADAAVVATLFQLAVIFNLILGWTLLGEQVTAWQVLGIGLVLIASTILALQREDSGKLRLRPLVLVLMVIATALTSVSDVVFKTVALSTSFAATQFFAYTALAVVASGICLGSPGAREAFVRLWRGRSRAWGWASLNEIISLGGFMLANYALLLAPIALVQAAVSTQGLFLVFFGLLAGRWWTTLGQTVGDRAMLARRISAMALMTIGLLML